MSEAIVTAPQEINKAKLILLGFDAAKNYAVTKDEVMPLALEFAKALYKEITGKEWI